MDMPVSLELTAGRPGSETIEGGGPFAGIDQAMLSDFVKAIHTGECKLDLKAGLQMTLPGLYALESSRNGGAVTKIEYPWD